MYPPLRLLVFLIVAIALRGFAGVAHSMPMPLEPSAAAQAVSAECPDHPGHSGLSDQGSQLPGDKNCQISCDLAGSPGLSASLQPIAPLAPSVLNPTRIVLALNQTLPPDHPPPIR